MTKHLCILVSPSGDEFYAAYGPMTKLRDRATRYASAAVAQGVGDHCFGRHDRVFWNSERASRDRAAVEYRGWTSRIEEVADDDEKRSGHYVMDYSREGERIDDAYAHVASDGGVRWTADIGDCSLWARRDDALAFVSDLPARDDRRYTIASY